MVKTSMHIISVSMMCICTTLWCAGSCISAEAPLRRNEPSKRQLQLFDADTSAGACSTALSTDVKNELAASYGVIFAVESALTDTVGPTVTSLGFHVEPNVMSGNTFGYEVYALNNDGFYADAERTDNPFDELMFDYRGDLEEWGLVSSGKFSKQDLQLWNGTTSNPPDYVEIPPEQFTKTTVPPSGGQRSFYVTLTSSGIVTAHPGDANINDVTALAEEQVVDSPKILIGEQVVSYPFSDTAYLYAKRAFVGTVYFESDCPTESPSVAASYAPSDTPSDVPSLVPSMHPSVIPSPVPSPAPSMMPSTNPSYKPSSSPSLIKEEVRSGLLLTLNLPECKYDENGDPIEMTEEEQASVSETVKAATGAANEGIGELGVEIFGLNTACERRRRLTIHDSDKGHFSQRHLPSATSAVEFSMVITGSFGGLETETTEELDLGEIAEASINRDQEKFIRDLADRAPPGSDLNDVQSLEVQAVELPPDGELVAFTKAPTEQPTQPPIAAVILEDDKSINKTALLIGIVVVTGFIIMMVAFLFFRLTSRKLQKQNAHSSRTQGEQDETQGPSERRRSSYITIDDASLVSEVSKILNKKSYQAKKSSNTGLTSMSSAMAPKLHDDDIKSIHAAQQQRFRNTVRAANAFRSKGPMPEVHDEPSYQVKPSLSNDVTSLSGAPKLATELQEVHNIKAMHAAMYNQQHLQLFRNTVRTTNAFRSEGQMSEVRDHGR